MAELNPCPFCGGEAELCRPWDKVFIQCKQCHVMMYPYCPGFVDLSEDGMRDLTVRQWNSRAEQRLGNRTTPDNIIKLQFDEVFVFGSNLAGRHGKGAARAALQWGAAYGQASGLQGRTYGIPTKDANVEYTLPIAEIKPYVDSFIKFAADNPHLTFLVTEIGCGLAALTPEEVAPLFAGAVGVQNIHLPARFWRELETK